MIFESFPILINHFFYFQVYAEIRIVLIGIQVTQKTGSLEQWICDEVGWHSHLIIIIKNNTVNHSACLHIPGLILSTFVAMMTLWHKMLIIIIYCYERWTTTGWIYFKDIQPRRQNKYQNSINTSQQKNHF